MKTIQLVRHAATPWGTFGNLYLPGHSPFSTLEPVWQDNEPNLSCIPVGLYPMVLKSSEKLARITHGKFSKAWFVEKVEGRSGVMIHPGNFDTDTEGCILPGMNEDLINGRPGVARSQLAYRSLIYALMNDTPSEILISWALSQPRALPRFHPQSVKEA